MSNTWRYYEGTSSANTVIKDIAKVLCTAVKTEEIKDANGNVAKPKEVIMKKNWDIVFPHPDKDCMQLRNVMDWNNLTPSEFLAKVDNQTSRAGDTVILKTRTSKKDLSNLTNVDDLGLENDLDIESIDMYVELYKPTYLADPEQYNPECERLGIMPYSITQDIYREYANSVGTVETNLKQICGGKSNFSVFQVQDPKSYGTGDSRDYSAVNEMINLINSALGSGYQLPNGNRVTIPLTTLEFDKMKGTALESRLSSVLGVPKSKLILYTGNISVRHDSYYGYYSYAVDVNRNVETYTLSPGFIYKLPEGEKIKPETVAFKLTEIGDPGAGTWSFDRVTCEFKVLKTITGAVEKIGDPVLSYSYEKEQTAITGRKLLYNNHYIYVRMFDKIKDDLTGPVPNAIDDKTGEVVQINSHVSEWSKLSWYQDYEEVMVDALDSDVGTTDISEGIVYLPVETPGLNADTRIRFWINCNNDRVSMVIMGNPSLDFGKNRHLISAAYLGQIESFDNSINDTAGNFSLFTSSSTVPCASKTKTKRVTMNSERIIGVGTGTVKEFNVSSLEENQFFESTGEFYITLDVAGVKTKLKSGESFAYNISGDKKSMVVTLFTAPVLGCSVSLKYDYYISKVEMVDGVKRDGFGNVLNTVYPNTYGKNTGTGVVDICMLHTRSKAYFQKHHMMFTTTEEYMTKEMYGKSAYTGEYYADRVKITHGNDGPRGMLADCLAVDTSSLYAFDELIVNRDFLKDADKPEETYIFFPITAPYSPFSGSPNATYGFAIKKGVKLPHPTTDEDYLVRAEEDLRLMVGNLNNLITDIVLPTDVKNVLSVTWESADDKIIEII